MLKRKCAWTVSLVELLAVVALMCATAGAFAPVLSQAWRERAKDGSIRAMASLSSIQYSLAGAEALGGQFGGTDQATDDVFRDF